MAAHQAPSSLGFSRQEHWSGLPFPSPMHDSEKWEWSYSLTLSDPMDWSPPGSSVLGIFQARVLEWVSIDYILFHLVFVSAQLVQFTQSYPTICNLMDCSTSGFPVYHWFLELAQTHVYWVGDAIQPSHSLSSPFPAFNLSQHQGLVQWISSSHQVAKVLIFQLQHQSF